MMKNSYNEIKKQQEKCIKVEVNESVNDVETKAETEIKQELKKPEFESLYNEKYFDNPMNEQRISSSSRDVENTNDGDQDGNDNDQGSKTSPGDSESIKESI